MEAQASVQKAAPRRERNVTMTIRVTQDEKDFILQKMKNSGRSNFNLYALKMLIVGEIKNIDLTHYHELAKEVNRVGTNINQIVKMAHSYGISESKIAGLQKGVEQIWQLLKSNLSELR